MKILVLGGCGIQGRAILYDLSRSEHVDKIICADYACGNPGKFKRLLDMDKISFVQLDVRKKTDLIPLLSQDVDVTIDVLPAQFMGIVFEAAIEAGCNLVNTNYGHSFLHLHPRAAAKGCTLMPECGFDPGIDLVICGHAVRRFDEVHVLNSYAGGIPDKTACDNPLNYKISWNWDMVLRSQKRASILIRDGRPITISPENQHNEHYIHELYFPGLGNLEAIPNGDTEFYVDLLGVGGIIREAGRYSLRWPGWSAFWRPLKKLGFLSEEPIPDISGQITPHRFLVKLLEPQLQYKEEEKDLVVMQNIIEGLKDGRKKKIKTNLLIERDLKTGLLAMSMAVGYPASIVAQMIVTGEIEGKGILSPAVHIPYKSFMAKLAERGIRVEETVEIEE